MSLNMVAAKLIMDGFIAYGWTEPELASTRTKLLDQLRQYIPLLSTELGYRDLGASTAPALPSPSTTGDGDAVMKDWHSGN